MIDIGDGTYPSNDNLIKLPQEICCKNNELDTFLNEVFPDLTNENETIIDRAILTPLNSNVTKINKLMIDKKTGELFTYFSADSAAEKEQAALYPTEFLNRCNPSGLPEHKLELKSKKLII